MKSYGFPNHSTLITMTKLIRYVCIFVLIHLRWVFNENTQRISVEGRPKRTEMYAFSKRISVNGAFLLKS